MGDEKTTLPRGKKVLIILTCVIYAIHLIFNGLANTKSSLFPESTGNVSDKFNLPITPAGATFSIWGFIFVFQIIWLAYLVSTVCRRGQAINIISSKFYIFFNLNIFLVVAWLLLWSRSEIIASCVILILSQLAIDATYITAAIDLTRYTDENAVTAGNKWDVWSLRVLLQNGMIFYATWTTIANMLNAAMVISYKVGKSTETASIIVLAILTVIILSWFVLENIIFSKYFRYVCAEYVVLIVASIGILGKNPLADNPTTSGFVLGLLILSAVLFVCRIIVIIVKEKRKHYGQMA